MSFSNEAGQSDSFLSVQLLRHKSSAVQSSSRETLMTRTKRNHLKPQPSARSTSNGGRLRTERLVVRPMATVSTELMPIAAIR